ncbi:hypothetical protein QOZ80_5BG0441170 [Eleusine coracana subsp. coracana]|nr:hypothetical protein QOZ80_5BG0441170 [Eleusine coracana subsp. coracana]
MAGSSWSSKSTLEKISLVFRVVTVGLSLSTTISTATATQSVYDDSGLPAATVSYSDYPSFTFATFGELVSAILQGVVIWLEVAGKEKWSKVVELIDKLVLALTSTSASVLLAVDEITSCRSRTQSGGGRQARVVSVCDQAGSFCSRIHFSAGLSLAAAISVSIAIYTRRVAATHRRGSIVVGPNCNTDSDGNDNNDDNDVVDNNNSNGKVIDENGKKVVNGKGGDNGNNISGKGGDNNSKYYSGKVVVDNEHNDNGSPTCSSPCSSCNGGKGKSPCRDGPHHPVSFQTTNCPLRGFTDCNCNHLPTPHPATDLTPPWYRCPCQQQTIPWRCDNPQPSSAAFYNDNWSWYQ